MSGFGTIRSHLVDLRSALADLERQAGEVERWGAELADLYRRRGRLLAAGNGGSAAEAQHLTAELVGRFEGERRPLSAIALHAESSSLTAIGNDYGIHEAFARQVEAHGRPGDVLLLLSTSGRSRNLLVAAERARECGLRVWALLGRPECPLARRADRILGVRSDSVSAIQEIHLIVVHALCAAVERHLDAVPAGMQVRGTAVS